MNNSIININNKNSLKNELKDFFIPYRKTLSLPNDITFGGEIEFRMKSYDSLLMVNKLRDNDRFISGFLDKQLGDLPWDYTKEINHHLEVVSAVLTDDVKTWQTLSNVLKAIIEKGGYYSGCCGAHVSVGNQVLNGNKKFWLRFFKMWVIFEECIMKFANGECYHLRANAWSKAASCKEDLINTINNVNNPFYKVEVPIPSHKTTSLNFRASFFSELLSLPRNMNEADKRYTTEFRAPNGTLERVIWQNNINFFCKLLRCCTFADFDDELVNHWYQRVVLKSEKESCKDEDEMVFLLANLVFLDDFDKCCFLRQYYKDFDAPEKMDLNTKAKRFWK